MDARLGLAELLGGLDVPSLGKVGDLARQSRAARADLMAALQDARQMGPPKFTTDGTAEVVLELPPQTPWRLVLAWQLKPPASDE